MRVTEPSHMVIRDVVIISLSPKPLADVARRIYLEYDNAPVLALCC